MTSVDCAPNSAARLFVFAGAGVSLSAPTNLPLFDSMRDTVLTQLGFGDYARTDWDLPATDRQKIIQNMAPEPFFGRLTDAGVDLSTWLRQVLRPNNSRSNAAHDALAELCGAGAKVWTVNFDPFIEESADASDQRIKVVAWPQQPQTNSVAGELLKPHGSLGGDFIITPADVLRPLSDNWRARLKTDLANCTHVVFVGYSGRDVDFQNVWRRAIRGGQHILWFDRPDSDRDHMLRVLGSVPSVNFPMSQPHRGAGGEITHNPSWDFVQWCRQNMLVSRIDDERQSGLLDKTTHPTYPLLPQSGPIVQARFAEALGDVKRARRLLWSAAHAPATGPTAARLFIRSWLNTPSIAARLISSMWWLVPPVWRITLWRRRLRHYSLVQLFNAGRHKRVVQLTDELKRRGELTDPLLGLRWGAQKMRGNVADVIDEAGKAARESRSTNNTFRCVAIFHWCHSLVWAARFDELRVALQGYLRPIAMITDSRWMAWADYIESCLLLADAGKRDIDSALTRLDSAITRFTAEGHRTGLIDVRTVQLTALRLHKDLGTYVTAARALQREDLRHPIATFGRQALILELAQGLVYMCNDLETARQVVEPLCASSFPVHAAVAHALRGQWESDETFANEHLRTGRQLASDVGLESIVAFCDDLLDRPFATRVNIELVFP